MGKRFLNHAAAAGAPAAFFAPAWAAHGLAHSVRAIFADRFPDSKNPLPPFVIMHKNAPFSRAGGQTPLRLDEVRSMMDAAKSWAKEAGLTEDDINAAIILAITNNCRFQFCAAVYAVTLK